MYILLRKNALHVGPVVYDSGLVLHSGPYATARDALEEAKRLFGRYGDFVISESPQGNDRGKCTHTGERK